MEENESVRKMRISERSKSDVQEHFMGESDSMENGKQGTSFSKVQERIKGRVAMQEAARSTLENLSLQHRGKNIEKGRGREVTVTVGVYACWFFFSPLVDAESVELGKGGGGERGAREKVTHACEFLLCSFLCITILFKNLSS